MEDEFYATVKLTTGEEVVAKVVYLADEDKVLLENPKSLMMVAVMMMRYQQR